MYWNILKIKFDAYDALKDKVSQRGSNKTFTSSNYYIDLSEAQGCNCFDSSSPSVHPCDKETKGGCEHVCNKDGDEAKCSCNDGYKLAEDGQECEFGNLNTTLVDILLLFIGYWKLWLFSECIEPY